MKKETIVACTNLFFAPILKHCVDGAFDTAKNDKT